jgi:hypothetical protein
MTWPVHHLVCEWFPLPVETHYQLTLPLIIYFYLWVVCKSAISPCIITQGLIRFWIKCVSVMASNWTCWSLYWGGLSNCITRDGLQSVSISSLYEIIPHWLLINSRMYVSSEVRSGCYLQYWWCVTSLASKYFFKRSQCWVNTWHFFLYSLWADSL